MTREDKKKIERRAYLHDIFRQLHNGPNLPLKLFALALFFVGAVYVATKQAALCEQVKHIELISPILKAAMEHALFAYLLVGARCCWRSCSIHLADGRRKTSFNVSAS